MSIAAKLSGIEQGLESVHDTIKKHLDNIPEYPDGISLLSCKTQVLTSYVHHLLLYVNMRLEQVAGKHVDSSLDEKLRLDVSRLRIILERGIKPLETKLKYQIEKVVRAANRSTVENGAEAPDVDDVDADPLAFRPNPGNFVPVKVEKGKTDNANSEDIKQDGIYRPPKLAPVVFPEDSKRKRRSPPPLRLLADESNALFSSQPTIESSSGLHMPGQVDKRGFSKITKSKSSKSALANASMDIRQRYEEDNFMRLSLSKKEAKRARKSEVHRRLGDDDILAGLGTGNYDKVDTKPKMSLLEKRKRRQEGGGDDVEPEFNGKSNRGAFSRVTTFHQSRQGKRARK